MHHRLQHWVVIFLVAGASALAYALPAPEHAAATATNLPLQITVDAAGSEWEVDGNARRYQQYVTTPEGLYLTLLGLQYLAPTGRLLIDASGRDIGQPSVNGSAWLAAGGDTAVLTGRERNSRFFRNWSAADDPFKRHDDKYELTMNAGPGDLRFSYDTVSLAQQGLLPEEDWNRRTRGIGYLADLGGWQAGAGFDRESFTFYEGAQFSGDTEALRFSFSPPDTGRTAVEANGALYQTSFDELSTAQRGNTVDLRAVHLLNSDLSLIGSLSRDEITDTIIQNAYAKRDLGGEVRAQYRGLPNTTLEVGGLRRRVDYVLQTQTATQTADQTGLFARATTRLNRQLRLRLQHMQQWTDDAPLALDQFGTPIGTLVWTARNDTQAELSYTLNWRTGLTGRYRKVRWENDDFATNNDMTSSSLTGWWLPYDSFTLYATYLNQDFDLNGITLDAGRYTTEDKTYVIGASLQASPRLLLDVAVTDTQARGATGVDLRNLWLGLGYTLKNGVRLGLRTSFGDFETSDDAPLLDYDARRFELGLSRIVF
ncbi:MAG: hypothetical protein ACYDCO_08195 [Armatimonadota bacterium]